MPRKKSLKKAPPGSNTSVWWLENSGRIARYLLDSIALNDTETIKNIARAARVFSSLSASSKYHIDSTMQDEKLEELEGKIAHISQAKRHGTRL